ncbi:hypothetical protein LCGC14_2529330, partial [marine sediment metagenome]
MYEPTTFDALPNSADASFSRGSELLGTRGHGSATSSHHGHRVDGITYSEWYEIVIAARHFAIVDPMCRQTIRLYTDHALGNGVTIQVPDDDKVDRSKAKSVLEGFFSEKTNQKHLSSTGQRKNSDRLGIDGNWYVALTVLSKAAAVKSRVHIRRLDTLQITEHITNPGDQDDVWFYLRETRTNDCKPVKRLYADISKHNTKLEELMVVDKQFPDKDNPVMISYLEQAERDDDAHLVPDVWVHHANINSTEERGNPLITTQMIWSKQFRVYMESRIALQQARTQLVREEIVTGGAGAVQSRQQTLQSSISSTQPNETNPRSIYGSTAIHNKGYELKNIEQGTAAQDAEIDGATLLRHAGLAAGIFPPYYGK